MKSISRFGFLPNSIPTPLPIFRFTSCTRPIATTASIMAANSFTIPYTDPLTSHNPDFSQFQSDSANEPVVVVNCPPHDSVSSISRTVLLEFPAFKTWLSTLRASLAEQSSPSHEFHKAPYKLRKIDIQAVDYFGGGRLGFIKMKADISNDDGEGLPGSILLRGGSVAMLLILQPDDIPEDSEKDKFAVMTIQPRIPAGTLTFAEIPAGMLDNSGSFAGGAAKEIREETGLSIPQNELIDMTALAVANEQKKSSSGQFLQNAVYPSPGGSDEFIPIFLCRKRMPRREIQDMQGRLTGNRTEPEKITLKIVPLENLWKEGMRDAKTLAAWALYEGLRKEGKL